MEKKLIYQLFRISRSSSPIKVLLCALCVFVVSVFSQESSLVWDKPDTVKRVAKTNRVVTHRRPKVEQAPLLTLQWRVLKRMDDGSSLEVNPITVFHTGDRIRMAIMANQNGYLYIIHRSEGQDGTIIFPDSRINNGLNYVKKNQEYLLPAYCPTPEFSDPRDCWWKMTPPGGREVFSVIFSRDMIEGLPNQVAEAGGLVKERMIKELELSSGQILKRESRPNLSPEQGGGAGRYVTWVTNTNKKDNEELIETVVLTHAL
jgi:hypothetical protein